MSEQTSTVAPRGYEGIVAYIEVQAFRIEVEETTPRTYRVVRYPDGSRTIQGGYFYQSGNESGLRWKDMPLVDVDENGQEVDL